MSKISYVNGVYLNHLKATVSIDDRGLQFSDGVYEVVAVWRGAAVDLSYHLARLTRSMNKLKFYNQPTRSKIPIIIRQIIKRNRITSGSIYIQVNRGTLKRNHSYTDLKPPCTCIVTARNGVGPHPNDVETGISLIVQDDERWKNRDIKSISLLPNILSKQAAIEKGYFDSIFLEPDGTVTETSTANICYVNKDGTIVTRALGSEILGGITRFRVLLIAKELGYQIKESTFKIEDLVHASEVFITSTTVFLLPVHRIGEKLIHRGKPGPIYKSLLNKYYSYLNQLSLKDSWNVQNE